MKNKEKYAKEIIDIACEGKIIAVTKDNKVVCCGDIDCEQCLFDIDKSCHDIEQWAESEYVENPTITSKEKKFLDLLSTECKYIARGMCDDLTVYFNKPIQINDYYQPNMGLFYSIPKKMYGNMFNFIKGEDEEPWTIEDLKKLEVKDE